MATVDDYVKEPTRLTDSPFLMSIEGIFMALGRGTVLTGKIEKGTLKINDLLEVVGPKEPVATLCLGIEMFRKSLDFAQVGDNVGILVKAVKRDQVRRGFVSLLEIL